MTVSRILQSPDYICLQLFPSSCLEINGKLPIATNQDKNDS